MNVGGVAKVAEKVDLFQIKAVGSVFILEMFYYQHV